ncbi:hypothetical protein Lal_00016157 [Lupinus albus]|nr:hypothetical protein Lal_00016157 [Lupinus albus]
MNHIGPGPIIPSLLTLQDDHVSTTIWNGGEVTFRARYNLWPQLPEEPVLQVIRNTAFGRILDIGRAEINNHLITALVERWRPETHTFHLPIRECTVTLEDVAYQLGLPIDGNIVTGPTNMDWNVVCHNLLGAVPNERQIVGQRIQMSWLDSTFQQLPDDATEVVIDQHARAFILRMIGGFLMPDTSGSRVHLMYLLLLEDLSETYQYSWGSAVLACLYRGLCRAALISRQIEIGGCLLLLQSWAYDRIPMLAPRLNVPTTNLFPLVRRWSQHLITTNIPGHATNIIRSMLDRLRVDQFVWTPYQNIDFMGQIPDMARSRVPLICFALVEWHAADRVMRQFGLQQPIPQDPINLQKQHKMDLRGKNDYNWQQKHDQWIQIWNHREDYVMNGLPNVQPLYHYSEYMQWYLQRTRKYISPDGAYSSGSVIFFSSFFSSYLYSRSYIIIFLQYNFIRSIRDQCAPSTVHDNPMQFIHGVYLQCNDMIDAFAKLLPTAFSDSNYQAPPTMPVAPEFQQQFESQTQTDTHPQAFTQQSPVPQQPFQFQSFGALSDYSISHQFGSSSHYEESLPTMFGTTSTTPLSAFNSEQYYQPTMPTQVDDEDDEDDEEEEEEVPQLVRGGTRQPTQPNLRVQPPRRKRPPPCGTSSHRRH